MSETVATTPAYMRRQNATTVLKAVRASGPLSRTEISRLTGLSKPTVNDIVSFLLSQSYLRESDEPQVRIERPGPRASQLTFAANVGFVLGIDLSFYKVTVVLADLDGREHATARLTLKPAHQRTAASFTGAVEATVEQALRDAGIDRSALWTVSIGIPGTFDRADGTIRLAPTLALWKDVPLGTMLRDLFDCPVLIENEVHLSVLAEQRWGGAFNVADAVYFHAGIGLALGLLIRGEIYRGADGIAGEIGYMLGSSTEDTELSEFGAFEWAAGGLAFVRLARKALADGRGKGLLQAAGGRPDRIDAKLVFACARESDSDAQAIVRTVVERLAIGVANICCILNPAVVILGAGLSQAGSDLLDPLKARVAELSPMPPRHFIVSELGPRAVILGAVEHALRAVEAARFNLFPERAGAQHPSREAAVA